MRTVWTFNGPGQLVFGRGAVGQIGEIARQDSIKRAMLVTDKTLVSAGLPDRVTGPLKDAEIAFEVFDGGQPDPPLEAVQNAVEFAKQFQPDVLIGLGGGSNMDLAKATAVVVTHGGTGNDYAGDQIVPGPVHPLILIPTTSGTGSEVTAAAVLNDVQAGTKFGVLSNFIRPRVALVDPLLTVSCPPSVTADSGIDALTHAVEAFTAVDNETFPLPEGEQTVYQGCHPMTDLMAEKAIRLVGQYLRRAVADGKDLEAREGMSLAATTAGYAFSNCGVAVVHALEYALAPIAHTSHGRGCGLLLPYVMKFNGGTKPERMARIAGLLGEDVSGLDPARAGELAIEAVVKLKSDIGIPASMSTVGVQSNDIPAMAEKAFGLKRILRVNPRTASQDDLQSIFQSAL